MTTTLEPSTSRPETLAIPDRLGELEERLERRAIRRDGWTLSIFVVAAIALVFSIIGVALGSRAIDEAKHSVAGAAAASSTAGSPVAVALAEFHIQPASTVLRAGKIDLAITNTGKVPHELLVFRTDLAANAFPKDSAGAILEEAPGMNKVSDGENLAPGGSQTRTLDLTIPGTYVFVCNLPGHFAAGMSRVVTVQ
jgi:uncharacterized cupredoxin-like copper-binding protein